MVPYVNWIGAGTKGATHMLVPNSRIRSAIAFEYEPFAITTRQLVLSVPWNEGFVGYGKDKSPWYYEVLHRRHAQVYLLTDVFTVHLAHSPSPARSRFVGVKAVQGGASIYNDYRYKAKMFEQAKAKIDALPSVDLDICRRVTVGIRSFARPNCVYRLVRSIRAFWPSCVTIIVADDSEPLDEMPTSILEWKLMASGVKLIRMPFDSGTAAGRNRMVNATATELIVILDDDFMVTRATNLTEWVRVLDRDKADVVGGVRQEVSLKTKHATVKDPIEKKMTEIEEVHSAGGLYTLDEGRLELTSMANADQKELTERRQCAEVQYVQQAFLARVSTLRRVRWDPVLKNNGENQCHLPPRGHDPPPPPPPPLG